MGRINSSTASLAMSATALFVALGGTALAVSQVGTSQIKNGAVTNKKLHSQAVTAGKIKPGAVGNKQLAGAAVTSSKLGAAAVGTTNLADSAVSTTKLADSAVSTTKLADSAVTSAKVADGTLTAGDVAPNTFLPATGIAADSAKLGGQPPTAYVRGAGKLVSGQLPLSISQGPTQFLELDFAHIDGTCTAGLVGKLRFVSELPIDNLVVWTTNPGAPPSVNITQYNAQPAGFIYEEPHVGGVAQSVTFQATYNDGTTEHIATAWATAQTNGGSCIFTGQAITTL